ncbi:DUF637 domain-containing protein [Verminephrobacter aporrectodeae]|nr:DUF637 domain-containing protein [Verminephrobacter aporrectodeae]
MDSSALGGMYANSIHILATQAGLGVRNHGTWRAGGGQIVVTVNGRLENHGTWQAGGGQIAVTANDRLENSGTIAAGAVSLVAAKGHIQNTGSIQGTRSVVTASEGDTYLYGAGLVQQTAGSAVVISAKGDVKLFNDAYHGATQVSSSTAGGGHVSISAGHNIDLDDGTSVAADKDVQLRSDDLVLARDNASVTSRSGNVSVLAGQGIVLYHGTVTGQQVHLETGAEFRDSEAGIWITGGNVRGQTQTTALATGDIRVFDPGSAAVSGGGNVHIQAARVVDIAAGNTITADRHMSVMAGTALTLRANSGRTATNGEKVRLSAGGNMLVSGGSVMATGSSLSARKNLTIEANDGPISLNALSNAAGASVDRITLSAGDDLKVSAFKGSLFATGLQANGRNISLASAGTTRVGSTPAYMGSNIVAVGSELVAREGITLASVAGGTSGQVEVVSSGLNAGGQVRLLANDMVFISADTNTIEGVASPATSGITGGSVLIQAETVQTDAARIRANGNKSSPEKSGDIAITATGDILLDTHTGVASQLNSTGNIALHANRHLTFAQTQVNAGGNLSGTSATGQINGTGASLVARDLLSLSSKDAQTHTNGRYSSGAATIFNQTGHLALNGTSVHATGTSGASGLDDVSGQISVESGGTMEIDAHSLLASRTDLSMIKGLGDFNIGPLTANSSHSLTMITRNGNINLTGSAGSAGMGSSRRVVAYANGNLTLAANNILLEGSYLQAVHGTLSLTATTGNITATALRASKTEAGFLNHYWDHVQLLGGRGVNVRAAGHIDMDGVFVRSHESVNIQSGGNTTIAGKHGRWTVDNRAYPGGWFQDETILWPSTIKGYTGVNIGAQGGNLTLNATSVNVTSGKASLQASGHIELKAAQKYVLFRSKSERNYETCILLRTVCNDITETTHRHHESLTNSPVTVTAQDIEVKAGNDLNTYGTKFHASRNLTLQAGDEIRYYAVWDQQYISETTHRERSLWNILTWDRSTTINSTQLLAGQPTQLQSQNDILSNSGGNQLLQGTQVRYGGRAAFNPGVGERARADAQIILELLTNTVTQTRTQDANYIVWQSKINSGSTTQTGVLPSFTGPSAPVFNAPGGLVVQIPDGDFRRQIQTLSQQPGMDYLNTLVNRTDVNWQPVKLAFNTWNYKQEGLTQAGAALVAVAVAWALGPAGAGLISSATTTMGMMGNAVLSSLASQAAIALINSKGNVGEALRTLGSSQTVKATIAAALTAGVLDKLGATSTMTDLSSRTGFSEKLTYNLINATGRALTTTAITGGNLEDALKVALVSGLVDTAHGQAASQIKGLEAEYLAHKLAHALAGCVAGAAAGGRCKDGAIGSAIGEVVASMFKPANGMFYTATEKANVLAYSKLVAGAASAYAGGNAQTAITTAEVAVENNILFVVPLVYMLAVAAGYTIGVGGGDPVAGLQSIGQGKDPLSQAIAWGTEKTVTLSMDAYPKETTAVLNFLSGVGETIDATVTYADDKTGRVVSTQWNSLSPATRDTLKGGGKVLSVVLGVSQVRAIKTIISTPRAVGVLTPDATVRKPVGAATPDAATPKPVDAVTPDGAAPKPVDVVTPDVVIMNVVDWTIKRRGKAWEEYQAKKHPDYDVLDKRQPSHKAFDLHHPITGHAISAKTIDTLGLSRGGKPMSPRNAKNTLMDAIKDARDYKKDVDIQPKAIETEKVKSRSVEVAIPAGTPVDVRNKLNEAVEWGRSQGVQVIISVTSN